MAWKFMLKLFAEQIYWKDIFEILDNFREKILLLQQR